MENIKHHMINIRELGETYTIYDYQKEGRKILDDLIKNNKNIVVAGGSGLYIKALLYQYNFEEEINTSADYEEYSNEELKKLIDEIHPQNEIHVNNRKRMIRFLSHHNVTGNIIKNTELKDMPLYDFKIIGLKTDRKKLYDRINSRVDVMFENGLLEEAKNLYKNNKKTDLIIGYKELNQYFDGNLSLDEAKEQIKKNTRRYAKRQCTWFTTQFNNINWVNVDYENFDKTVKEAIKIIK